MSSPPPIDLRSDTVTQPSAEMRRAMAEAEVGDDVMNEDPTVLRLQEKTAELLGKEAALFVPSGTMSNQIAIGLHTKPGDELICEPTAHVYLWEGGGIARLWGVTTRTVEPLEGPLDLEDLQGKIRPNDPHYSHTRLVCLENTQNRNGGKIHPIAVLAEIAGWARAHGLAMHLDGARLMNAVVASGIPASEWARYFDTVSICYSKGLGAPIGSALVGSSDAIAAAHRLRKVLGGGMRQAGIVAAGALYALGHNVNRLAEDHKNASLLARAIDESPGLSLESGLVETNLVWIAVAPELGTAKEVAFRLKEQGVLVSVLGTQVIRACTHLNVSREQTLRAVEVFKRVGDLAHA